MEERIANGWQYGKPRDNKLKLHDLLVPYADLPDTQKAKDQDLIDNIPAIVKKAGYRILWLGQ
jgi:hypothetical protein